MSGAQLIQRPDGAHPTALAVLALVRLQIGEGLQGSYDDGVGDYLADIRFSRFDNCREQGYFIYLPIWKAGLDKQQLNIAFAENRSSDDIVVYSFEAPTFNAPTLADVPEIVWTEGRKFFKYNEHYQAAEYIVELLNAFWAEHGQRKAA